MYKSILAIIVLLTAQALAQPTLQTCTILANNSHMPMTLYPWNGFTCGRNARGWVWGIALHKWGDEDQQAFMVDVVNMESGKRYGETAVWPKNKATFYGPSGTKLTIEIVRSKGTVKDWKHYRVWANIRGTYIP